MHEDSYVRLKEEKTLIAVEVVSLLFIVLSTIIIEVADYNINQWTSKLLVLQSEASDILNNKVKYLLNSHFLTVMQVLNAKSEPYTEQDYLLDKKYIEKEFSKPWAEFKNGKISLQEYILKIREPITRKYFEFINLYNQKKTEINNQLKNQPKLKLSNFNIQWDLIRKVFNVVRIVAIIIATFIYIFLYRSIGQRLINKNRGQNYF